MKMVSPPFQKKGFERNYQIYTDDNGSFAHQFQPLANESGSYQVSLLHPDSPNDRNKVNL